MTHIPATPGGLDFKTHIEDNCNAFIGPRAKATVVTQRDRSAGLWHAHALKLENGKQSKLFTETASDVHRALELLYEKSADEVHQYHLANETFAFPPGFSSRSAVTASSACNHHKDDAGSDIIVLSEASSYESDSDSDALSACSGHGSGKLQKRRVADEAVKKRRSRSVSPGKKKKADDCDKSTSDWKSEGDHVSARRLLPPIQNTTMGPPPGWPVGMPSTMPVAPPRASRGPRIVPPPPINPIWAAPLGRPPSMPGVVRGVGPPPSWKPLQGGPKIVSVGPPKPKHQMRLKIVRAGYMPVSVAVRCEASQHALQRVAIREALRPGRPRRTIPPMSGPVPALVNPRAKVIRVHIDGEIYEMGEFGDDLGPLLRCADDDDAALPKVELEIIDSPLPPVRSRSPSGSHVSDSDDSANFSEA